MDIPTFEETKAQIDRGAESMHESKETALERLKKQRRNLTPKPTRTRVITLESSFFEEDTPVIPRTRPRSGTMSAGHTPTEPLSFFGDKRPKSELGKRIQQIKSNIWAQRKTKAEIDVAGRRELTEYIANHADSLPDEELRYARDRRDSLPESPRKRNAMVEQAYARAMPRAPAVEWTRERIQRLGPMELHRAELENGGKWPSNELAELVEHKKLMYERREWQEKEGDQMDSEQIAEYLEGKVPDWQREYLERKQQGGDSDRARLERASDEELRAIQKDASAPEWVQEYIRGRLGAPAAAPPAAAPAAAPARRRRRVAVTPWTAYYATAKKRDELATWRQEWRSSLGWGRWDARYVKPLLRTII